MTIVVETSESMAARAFAFIDAWRTTPHEAPIDFHIGKTDDGQPSVLIRFSGSDHAFTVTEALTLATAMEEPLADFADDPEISSIPAVIAALRSAAADAVRRFGS